MVAVPSVGIARKNEKKMAKVPKRYREEKKARVNYKRVDEQAWKEKVSSTNVEPSYSYFKNSLFYRFPRTMYDKVFGITEDVATEDVDSTIQNHTVKKAKEKQNLEFKPDAASAWALGHFLSSSKQLDRSRVNKISAKDVRTQISDASISKVEHTAEDTQRNLMQDVHGAVRDEAKAELREESQKSSRQVKSSRNQMIDSLKSVYSKLS